MQIWVSSKDSHQNNSKSEKIHYMHKGYANFFMEILIQDSWGTNTELRLRTLHVHFKISNWMEPTLLQTWIYLACLYLWIESNQMFSIRWKNTFSAWIYLEISSAAMTYGVSPVRTITCHTIHTILQLHHHRPTSTLLTLPSSFQASEFWTFPTHSQSG